MTDHMTAHIVTHTHDLSHC